MIAEAEGFEAVWQDVECGSYTADLELWRSLAAATEGRLAELGAGTGRVSLALARDGAAVSAVERSPALLSELGRRAAGAGLSVELVRSDAVELEASEAFAAIIAPMQFLHLPEPGARPMLLAAVCRALVPGGTFAAALLAERPVATDMSHSTPLPDVLERDGWVFSSRPVAVREGELGSFELVRHRQAVSPSGELSDETDTVALHPLDPEAFEAEARGAGLEPCGRAAIAATADHVGSTVVLARRPRS